MRFIKYPYPAFHSGLNHAEKSIFLVLCEYYFRHCYGKDRDTFYLTDRTLASLSSCSTHTVWRAKTHLKSLNLIDYSRGESNKTWYTITCLT